MAASVLHALAAVVVSRVGGQRLFQGSLGHIVVGLGHGGALLALRDVSTCAHRGQEVNDKGEDVSSEDKGDDPFDNSTGVLLRAIIALHTDCEGDGKGDFNDDEG